MEKSENKIRELNREDIDALGKIFALYWDKEFTNKFINRLNEAVEKSPYFIEQKFIYFVAEIEGEVIGVAGMRKMPKHMLEFATTTNP